ncbi:MAG: hypothetical protein HY423_06635 [Candidatus Lambdaproteobacteria bacterium]|nr:hypothetical protein [Candidatus Lambdaproteobacteria bacterium]
MTRQAGSGGIGMTIEADLVVLTADLDTENALRGLLESPERLAIRQITYDLLRHPMRDNGCRTQSGDHLRRHCDTHSHALVVFDLHGSGHEHRGRDAVESQVMNDLNINGWEDRAEVVVIDPELEAWVWSDSSHVSRILGFGSNVSLKQWLIEQTFLQQGQAKPANPKGALKSVLRHTKTPFSASDFQKLASSIHFYRCTDPTFQKLLATLRAWFPAAPSS